MTNVIIVGSGGGSNLFTSEETLSASSWTTNTTTKITTYVLSNSNIKAENCLITISPSTTITLNQLNALQYANIISSEQTDGSVTLKCMGDVPTIDIPITLTIQR